MNPIVGDVSNIIPSVNLKDPPQHKMTIASFPRFVVIATVRLRAKLLNIILEQGGLDVPPHSKSPSGYSRFKSLREHAVIVIKK
jgi:hypothetical protein